MNYPIPEDEAERLAALREYDILDTVPEQAYDDITLLASQICQAPIAAVTMIDSDRQWFKSSIGMGGTTEIPRDIAFCAHVVAHPSEMLVIPDTQQDTRFVQNPLVTEDPHMRFYAGAALVTAEGHALGSLCVAGPVAKDLSQQQRAALNALSRQVVAQMELKRKLVEVEESRRSFNAFMDNSPALAFIKDSQWRLSYVNQPFLRRFDLAEQQVVGKTDFDLWPEAASALRAHDEEVMRGESVHSLIESTPSPAGERFWQVYKFPLQWHGERVLAGLALDVTESKENEQRLEEYQMELERALARVEEQSVTDALTGLRNRRAFERKLEEEFERAVRYGTPLSLLLLDVDKFKSFNDTFGHPAGDDLLQKVARLLAEKARSSDLVARYGGEEFAVILPNTESQGAFILAERFRRAIGGSQLAPRSVTISIGVATVSQGISNTQSLLLQADRALYASKAAGRNRVTQADLGA